MYKHSTIPYSSKCPMGSKFVASRTSKSGRDLKYLIKLYKSILKLQTWAFLDMTLNLKAIQKRRLILS